MSIIAGILGLIIGIVLFVLLIDRLHFIVLNWFSLMMIFTICVGIGCALAYLLGWLIIIAIVIGVIYVIFFDDSDNNNQNNGNPNSNNNQNNT